ncbi:TIGR02594 family protein [Sphingomonas endolithica]|uniref:TIGR02594 family protein n=1 Tax=Sphingomonas endolithica TaxID=2972485 RepID=UPI0021AF9C7D|nr:TIGR02594 family protein [Sphingomonas sp. ZFBP2030]
MTTASEPAWLGHARSLLGTREAAGAANSPTILGWAKLLGTKVLGMVYNADSVPWCGLFVANCLRAAGIDLSGMKVAVRAKEWATWGSNLSPLVLAPGAILVFDREGGGHVAFYVGEDRSYYHVLGGNQGDKVSIMRLEKSRCIARRWPRGVPVIGKPVKLTAGGVPVSSNEA